MTAKPRIFIAGAVVVLLAAALLGTLIPKQIQGDVLTVRFVSLESSDTASQATFSLHNKTGPKVDVLSASVVQSGGGQSVSIAPITMEKGDIATVAIAAPIEGKWRAEFTVHRHGRQTGTFVYGAWIDGESVVPDY